jgi:hypothetical protein
MGDLLYEFVERWRPRGVGRRRFPRDRWWRFPGKCATVISIEACGSKCEEADAGDGSSELVEFLVDDEYPNSIRKREKY